MRTEDLVSRLAENVPPVPRRAGSLRLATGVGGGGVLAFGLLLAGLGLRPDLAAAAGTAMFWMKFAFTLSLAGAAFVLVRRLGRPGVRAGGVWLLVAAPVAIMAAFGAVQLSQTPAPERMGLWVGHSAIECPLRIMVLAAPVFCGLLWAFRGLAPTRLPLAGFGAGVLAGSAAASVYALACTESGAAFLATWYTLGILSCGVLGALVGPRLLRW